MIYRKINTLVFLLVVSPVALRCQISSTDLQTIDDGFVVSADANLNMDDILLGLQLGAWLAEDKLSITGLFLVRPYEKRVQIKRSDNYYYQYREVRFGLGCNIEKQIHFRNIIFYLSGGPLLSFGDFKGSSRKPGGGLTPIVGAGIVKYFTNHSIMAGYQYINLPRTSHHFFKVSLFYHIIL